jgi:hypothetical protein
LDTSVSHDLVNNSQTRLIVNSSDNNNENISSSSNK